MISYVSRDPQESLGVVPPGQGIATIEKLAINSVMGGCLPEYFPVVIAAMECLLDPHHNLNGTQTTTHCNEPLIIVNGPIAKELQINSEDGVLGRGYRANGTIGRAIRLILWNLGRNFPGEVDKSSFSHPGAWSYCLAENEKESPWEPLHVERGLPKGSNGVTVFSCEAPHSVVSHGDIEETLGQIVRSLTTTAHNNFFAMGELLIILSPRDVKQLAASGWNKVKFKQHIWEHTAMPVGLRRKCTEFAFSTCENLLPEWLKQADDSFMPLTKRPEDIHVVVAGGQYFNMVAPGWGCFGGFAVTREIKS
ncbi:hypothetical protein ACFLWX_04200 [Chloroflexota bacterium]